MHFRDIRGVYGVPKGRNSRRANLKVPAKRGYLATKRACHLLWSVLGGKLTAALQRHASAILGLSALPPLFSKPSPRPQNIGFHVSVQLLQLALAGGRVGGQFLPVAFQQPPLDHEPETLPLVIDDFDLRVVTMTGRQRSIRTSTSFRRRRDVVARSASRRNSVRRSCSGGVVGRRCSRRRGRTNPGLSDSIYNRVRHFASFQDVEADLNLGNRELGSLCPLQRGGHFSGRDSKDETREQWSSKFPVVAGGQGVSHSSRTERGRSGGRRSVGKVRCLKCRGPGIERLLLTALGN